MYIPVVEKKVPRRRFLKRSAAAGTGILVVTVHHQRAIAGAKKIMTSTAATCLSMHGTPSKQTQVHNVTNPGGPLVNVTVCTIPK